MQFLPAARDPRAASLFNLPPWTYDDFRRLFEFFRATKAGRQIIHSMRVANCDATDNRPANKMNEKELCGLDYIREYLLLSLSFSLSVSLLAIKKRGC